METWKSKYFGQCVESIEYEHYPALLDIMGTTHLYKKAKDNFN
jgi:hypothetical protein